MSSFKEGAPDYAELGNADVMAGAPVEYEAHASAFQDSTNVFMPYYRQAGLRLEGETWKKTGSFDSAISGMPYDDITAALDYYFENYNEGRGASRVPGVLNSYNWLFNYSSSGITPANTHSR